MIKTILLVDDDQLVRETVRLALRHAGYDVRVAEDPSRADEQARQEPPDLVVLDLYMPNVDGLELCRRLKGHPSTAKVPVVVFSGSEEEIDKVAAKEAGAVDFIEKPIDAKKLLEKIKGILKKNAR